MRIIIIICLLLTGCTQDVGNRIGVVDFEVGGEIVTVGGERLLGGTEIQNFTPEVKLEKWGDETYVRVWSEETGDDFATQVGDKIIWENTDKSKEYNFYPLTPEQAGTEDGGFEYEIILKEKPKSNVIELRIETKDLVFYYQPELTQEEIDNGDTRPENVVGSYAVYHATKANHIDGQTNYKAGKAFHIYRPQMEDADGWKVWGYLHIENGILSVTIPQDFLDKAKYPVKHATGLTIGRTALGGTTSAVSADDVRASNIDSTTSAAGDVDSISFGGSDSTPDDGKGFITDSSGVILANGVATPVTFGADKGWLVSTYDGTKPSVSDSTVYYPAVIASGAVTLYVDSLGASDASKFDNSNSYATPQNCGFSDTTTKYSIYATYTEAGEPSGEPKSRIMEIIIID